MNRRTLLAVLGASLSGCTQFRDASENGLETSNPGTSRSDDNGDCGTRTTTGEVEPDGRILRRVSLETVASVPVDGVDISVELSPSAITTSRTARLHVTFTNTSDEEQTFGFHGKRLPFSKRTSSDAYSWVLLTEADNPSRAQGDCWRPAGERELYNQLDSIERRTLSACESLSNTFQLWTHPRSDGCLPTGEYAFRENTFLVFDSENGTKDKETEFSWGFELDVQSP